MATLITGASMGLGKAMAWECARRGMNLVLTALPGERLAETAGEIEKACGVRVLAREIDLTEDGAPARLAAWALENTPIDVLINNAGFGGSRAIENAEPAYIERMIRLNVLAVGLLTHALLPELKTHPSARVLNVASLAACGPLPFKTVYPASKAFVFHWSRGLRAELRKTNVRVCVLLPGPMRTNPDVRSRLDKQGWIGRRTTVSVEAAARLAVRGLFKGRAVIVPGAAAKLNRFLMAVVPTPVLLFFTGRVFSREAN
ncbi:MAG: SDR family NAD(P)-dependent oxidoreductase [Candidatus Aminicenantales bacterium]